MFSLIKSLIKVTYEYVMYYMKGNKWYIIEGNIGCGKTTLITNLKFEENVEVIEEPVDEWKNQKDEHGKNILGLFYEDSKRYAYLFQTLVFKSRLISLEIPQTKRIRFSERSIWTDKNIFTKNCYELGFLSKIEKDIYDYWFHWLESKIRRMPDGIFYLRAPAEVCHTRMKKRDRAEETSVPLEYLQSIHKKHEEWLNNGNSFYQGIPIYIIDNTDTTEYATQQVMRIVS